MPTREIILNALTKRGKNVFRRGVSTYATLLEQNSFDKKFLDQIINETTKHKQKDCNLIYEMFRKADKFEKRVLIYATEIILKENPIIFLTQVEEDYTYGGNALEKLFTLSNAKDILIKIFPIIYQKFIINDEYNYLLPERYHNIDNFVTMLDLIIDQHGYIEDMHNMMNRIKNKNKFINNLN